MLHNSIARYHQQASDLRPLLEEVLAQLDISAVPDVSMPEKLCQALLALHSAYDDARKYAAELLSADELPPYGAPITAYQAAVEASRRLHMAAALNRFMQVQTTHTRYSDALERAQSQASALLQQSGALTDEMIAPYATFLKALALGNALNDDTPEANTLLDALEQHNNLFDNRLVNGLCRGAFILREEESIPAEVFTPEAAPAVVAEPVIQEEPACVQPSMHADEPAPESTPAPASDALPVSSDAAPISEPAPAPEEQPAQEEEPVQEEESVCVRSFTNHSLPSPNKLRDRFRSDMDATVLIALGVLHVLTPELIVRARPHVFGERTDVAASVLETMENRGFLCSYDVDGERLYCCSPMLSSCFSKNDRYQLLNERAHILQGNHRREWRKPVLFHPSCIARNPMPLSALRRYRRLAELVSDFFFYSDDVGFHLSWNDKTSSYELHLMSNPSMMMTAVAPEDFLVAPSDFIHPLVSTAETLPAAELMTSCPANCRYFICHDCFVWDGAAWVSTKEKPSPASEEHTVSEKSEAAISETPEAETSEVSESVSDMQELSPEAAEPAHDVPQQEMNDIQSTPDKTAEEPAEETPSVEEDSLSMPEEPATAAVDTVPEAEEHPDEQTAAPEMELLLPDGTLNRDALQRVVQSSTVLSDASIASLVMSLLARPDAGSEGGDYSVYDALLLAAAAATRTDYVQCQTLSAQLQMATGLLAEKNPWTTLRLSETFSDGAAEPSLMLAAYAQALFTPADAHDHWLLSQARPMLNDYSDYFPDLPEFKALYNTLLGVQQVSKHGFAPAVIAQLGNNAENEAYTQQLRQRAHHYMEPALTMAPTNTRERQAGIVDVYEALFQAGSNLYICMDVIANNRTKDFDFVDSVLQEYCTEQQDERSIDHEAIVSRLDAVYREKRKTLDAHMLYPEIQHKAVNQIVYRLEIMKEWLEHVDSMQQHAVDLTGVKRLRNEILKEIESLFQQPSWQRKAGSSVLKMMLRRMETRLLGTPPPMHFVSLLHTGCFLLTDEGMPIIDASLNTVLFQEPWRLALKHMLTPLRPLDAVVDEILGNPVSDPVGVQDNLHQLSLIGRYLGDTSERYQISAGQRKEATDAATERMRDFRARLELAYTYDRISESDKESLLQMMDHYQPIFFKCGDFACWHRFIDALTKQMDASAAARRQKLSRRLHALLSVQPDSQLLHAAKHLLEKEMNFAVAEEYMNRVDSGEPEHVDDLAAILHDPDYFCDFISPEVFEPLYRECSRNTGNRLFRNFAQTYVERHAPSDWTSRHFESSRKLYTNWPTRRGATSAASIQALFSAFGLDVVHAAVDSRRREEVFQLTVRPTPCSMADYRHPIAAFGTLLKSPLNVIVLYGNFTERQLVDAVTSLDLREMSVVLLDRPLNVSQRRNIGEIFHNQTSGINPFILVDQVLALYLALHQITERMSAMLKCTLPFTIYNPFVHDSGPTADEMFFGRAKELRSILDLNGACVVYGGRQLGKSALLARAESLFSKPEAKCFAAKVTTYQCHNEQQFVTKITEALNTRTNGKITFTDCSTIKELTAQLEAMYRTGVYQKMLLLIDEADDFLDAISKDRYDQLWPLVDLRNYTKRNFKIVLAGLHNVCRAQAAEETNSVFAQLGTSLCVEPLSPADALQLLTRPLHYLGFRIDQIQHMETILTNTNYYPGILQFFGYKLVEAMTTHYSRYYRAVGGNPPFSLQDEQLGAVMSSADLNNSIHQKFRLSLELDPRYYMIARCIALLCHLYEEDGTALNWMGYSVQQIQQIAQEYDIHCLASADRRAYLLLMDEMVNMGILSRTSEGRYRLRRSSFIDVIGRDMNALEAEIIEMNGGAEA